MFYEEVFKILNKKRVRYVVAGGIAVVLHGFARFTADLDIILHLEEENRERLDWLEEANAFRSAIVIRKVRKPKRRNPPSKLKRNG